MLKILKVKSQTHDIIQIKIHDIIPVQIVLIILILLLRIYVYLFAANYILYIIMILGVRLYLLLLSMYIDSRGVGFKPLIWGITKGSNLIQLKIIICPSSIKILICGFNLLAQFFVFE